MCKRKIKADGPQEWCLLQLLALCQPSRQRRGEIFSKIKYKGNCKSVLEQARPIFIMYTVNRLNNRNFYEFQVGAKVHQWMTGVTEFIHQSLNYSQLSGRGYGLNTDQCWFHVSFMPSVSEGLFFWQTWQLLYQQKRCSPKSLDGGTCQWGSSMAWAKVSTSGRPGEALRKLETSTCP